MRAPALAAGTAPGAAPGEPWEIPDSALGQQRLFRVEYQGAQGETTLRLVLRLARPRRYELAAADALGRPRWTLRVDESRGLWIDHRARRYCSPGDEVRLPGTGLPELPLSSVPALLLGRLPVPPAMPATSATPGEIRDRHGRRWTFELAPDGAPRQWTLWQDERAALWWSRRGDECILSARDHGVQLRWREIVREPLVTLAPIDPPDGFVEAPCDGPDLP